MFCKNCGKELPDNVKFCAGCGASVPGEDGAVAEVPETTPTEPEKGAGKKKGLIVAVAVVAVVAVLVALIAGGVFSSAKTKVGLAVAKSLGAYTDAIENTGMTGAVELLESQKFSQNMELVLGEIDGVSAVEGFGLKAKVDVNIPSEKIGVSGSAVYGATSLVTGQLAIEGSTVSVGSPELLGDKFYGLDTTKLGADLAEWTGADEVEDISFNVFDLVEVLVKNAEPDKDVQTTAEKGVKDLIKAIEVEKGGSETVKVNGNSVKCTAYQVVIPQDALEDYLDVVFEVMESTDTEAMMEELFAAMGLNEDIVEDMLDEMPVAMKDMGYAQDAIEEVLDVLGDIEVTVYVKGKYAMAVVYENKIEGVKIEGGIYMGGGKNFADDFSVVAEIKDYYTVQFELVSTGNHTGVGGAFTDETTIQVKEDGETYFDLTSELSYNTKGKDKNFSWTLSETEDLDIEVEAEGHVSASSKGLSIDLSELTVSEWGDELFTVELKYEITDFSMGVEPGKPVMINGMDEDDLEEIVEEIAENGEAWSEDVYELLEDELSSGDLEELRWMLYYMFW